MKRLSCPILFAIIGFATTTTRGDWPVFRGPSGTGVSDGGAAPTSWSGEVNIRWKAALPNPGNGSPIVVGESVFVTSAQDAEGRQRSLYCLDTDTGREKWVRSVSIDKVMPTHKTNPYCGSTPVSDGKRVVVWHASAGLFCYDLQGNQHWSRDLGEFHHMWGYGSSPILHKDRVILFTGPGKRTFVTAIDLESGKTIWETDEPQDGGPDRNSAGQYMGSWSTPVVANVDGKAQVLVMMPTRINAYDTQTGQILWTCDGNRHARGDLAYSSPVLVDDICFMTGGFRGVSMAIRLGGTGNVTQTHRLWRKEKVPQNIGSGVAVDGLVYRPNAGPNTIECINPKTGEVLWEERAGKAHWASIVMAGDLLYATDQDSTTIVFRPNSEKLEIVATNSLPGSCNATPALDNGRIYIRTNEAVYCIDTDPRDAS